MKKWVIALIILIIGISSFAKEKVTVVDENYLMENYEKTKEYNEKLRLMKEAIEKKYSLTFDENMNKLEKTKEYQNFKKTREELSQEINLEIEWAMYVVCETENLYNKGIFLYGKTNDITKKVLDFLNEEYKRENPFKKKMKKTDIMGVIA